MFMFIVLFIVTLLFIHVVVREYYAFYNRRRSLKGKIVLITGSANGFGKDLCLAFAQEQCHLICIDIDEKGNQETVRECKQISDRIRVIDFTCDITNPQKVRELSKKVYEEFDHVDVLYNNAGVAYPGRINTLTDEHIQRLINVNLLSHFWTIRTFLPKMMERKRGLIVATSSIAGRLGTECLAPYCASKFGVVGLMDSLKNELNAQNCGVRTLTVHPGFMATRLMPKAFRNPGLVWLKPYKPLHISDAKDAAKEVIIAVKEGKTRLYYPYYNILVINGLKYCLPQFIGDWICSNIMTFSEYVDPL